MPELPEIKAAALFRKVREFNLPLGEYAITSSGPLGIRGIRDINDVDIIASDRLFERLEAEYGLADTSLKKIQLAPDIEVFCEASFARASEEPTVEKQIKGAEVIEGLPFVSLDHLAFYKRKMGRPKDIADLELITRWKKENA